ncbi:hypothetical protein [Parablautia intestinalis]|uniref:hypothetical protein n=1 Tax=Parablautia intestinalis TaxID=2320100 RepID=UPI0024128C66|nr:hypothetical protein [Parablautia intestinalis]
MKERIRDMASNSRVMMWLMNHIEIPIANKVMHKGDVHVYGEGDIQKLCDASGMVNIIPLGSHPSVYRFRATRKFLP